MTVLSEERSQMRSGAMRRVFNKSDSRRRRATLCLCARRGLFLCQHSKVLTSCSKADPKKVKSEHACSCAPFSKVSSRHLLIAFALIDLLKLFPRAKNALDSDNDSAITHAFECIAWSHAFQNHAR